jgi:acetolactate decarboxylase
MNKLICLLLVSLVLSGCANCQNQTCATDADLPVTDRDQLYQTSTITALLAGVYDGDLTCGELLEKGDIGLGTFNALNGEMIVLDGEVYQVPITGVPVVVADDTLTPFAAVTPFDVDVTLTSTEPMDLDQLKAFITANLPNDQLPYAIRIEGTFSAMTTRSVPAQTRPYQPLLEVVRAGQVTFDLQDVTGTVVGFYLPQYAAGVNVAGYHFHFLTADRQAGGHVLSLNATDITIMLDDCASMDIDLLTSEQTQLEGNATDQLHEIE